MIISAETVGEEIILLLIEHGADVSGNIRFLKQISIKWNGKFQFRFYCELFQINKPSEDGINAQTPLHIAIFKGINFMMMMTFFIYPLWNQISIYIVNRFQKNDWNVDWKRSEWRSSWRNLAHDTITLPCNSGFVKICKARIQRLDWWRYLE